MGAFHEGHLDLMRHARAECEVVAVSLFVNPTQFGPAEDFSRYPRDEERDFAMALEVGVDLMFAPSVEEMYPRKTTSVCVRGVSEYWEGQRRPGHFEGVATVVAKLFHIVAPQRAYFGLKDLQQCAVIRQMVEDLNFPIELRLIETVREPDGLAMSSRNAYLAVEERIEAPRMYRELSALSQLLSEGGAAAPPIERTERTLREHGWDVEYLALVHPLTMEPLDYAASPSRLVAAARLGRTRLIDNVAVFE